LSSNRPVIVSHTSDFMGTNDSLLWNFDHSLKDELHVYHIRQQISPSCARGVTMQALNG